MNKLYFNKYYLIIEYEAESNFVHYIGFQENLHYYNKMYAPNAERIWTKI